MVPNGENIVITQAELKKALHYCPKTGVFTWKIKTCQKVVVGRIAGHAHFSKKDYSCVFIGLYGTTYRGHRLAWFYMTGNWPKDQIDHIDHNPMNNIFSNLRESTNLENNKNLSSKRANKASNVFGVNWHKKNKNWVALICVKYERMSLGSFDNLFDAICARKSAELKHGFHSNHGK